MQLDIVCPPRTLREDLGHVSGLKYSSYSGDPLQWHNSSEERGLRWERPTLPASTSYMGAQQWSSTTALPISVSKENESREFNWLKLEELLDSEKSLVPLSSST